MARNRTEMDSLSKSRQLTSGTIMDRTVRRSSGPMGLVGLKATSLRRHGKRPDEGQGVTHRARNATTRAPRYWLITLASNGNEASIKYSRSFHVGNAPAARKRSGARSLESATQLGNELRPFRPSRASSNSAEERFFSRRQVPVSLLGDSR
jgi:hypothetical protein